MLSEIFHQYSEHKNKELYWLTSDTKDLYLENLKTNYDKLNQNGWIDRQFAYKFNSHGFRCDEFTNENSIMFLGCSFTCGIGLPLEDTWAYQVANSLNLKSVNLGIGGSGPDTAFRLANHYIPIIVPKIVVYLEPPLGRFSLVNDDKIYDFCVSNKSVDTRFKYFYEHWLSCEENLILDARKHKLAIEMMCQQSRIKFEYKELNEIGKDHLARDLMHPGVSFNKTFANLVLNRINQNS